MKIILEMVQNGVIATIPGDEGERDQVTVFETEYDNGEEKYDGRTSVLWHVIDQLGWYGSKHDAKRIRVHIEEREEENA